MKICRTLRDDGHAKVNYLHLTPNGGEAGARKYKNEGGKR